MQATIADGGAIFVNAADAERFKGGAVAVAVNQRPAETFTFVVPIPTSGTTNTFNITVQFPILLVNAHLVSGGTSATVLTVGETANICITCIAPGTTDVGDIGNMGAYVLGNADIPAGGTMRLITTNTGHANDYAVVTAIRA